LINITSDRGENWLQAPRFICAENPKSLHPKSKIEMTTVGWDAKAIRLQAKVPVFDLNP
jgi:hypothetical protein